ncbi:MAG: tRNA uridine-5-carboxymethylaminomethyl(34) synthesis GTPase MnmE [Prevotella sp.]|nr:tRNA uridine-5-carboxymethylaminomethyl(34) synthesis GTPase MnmE [Prevotella sp.]
MGQKEINTNDTICAPATATGGALSIIRVSGSAAFKAVSALCSVCCDSVAANTTHFTRLKDGSEIVDEAMVSIFRAPHSYTGEDAVELSCHGSPYILNRVLGLLVQHGCRMAQPGEFTKRAYLNGKMDLSQAEAVADLIASTNRASHQMAMSQLRGHFSSELSKLRDQLLELTSLLELELDFSDHEDLEFADRTQLLNLAEKTDLRITALARSFETGQALKHGVPVAIIGRTNVGKSTLLNRLLKDERAIVSDVHGTTRDTIEDVIDIQGVAFRFIDTAGIRQTTDQVEQIGIQRTYDAIAKARIVLWLFDQVPTEAEVADLLERTAGKALIPIRNKSDLGPLSCEAIAGRPVISISAKHAPALDVLEQAIYRAANISDIQESDIVVSSVRHYQALQQAHENLSRVLAGLRQDIPSDLLAEDLRLVLDNLAQITGQSRIVPSEVLENIFRHYCIGK